VANLVTIEYECCGTTYTTPTALRPGSLLLHNAALADTLIAMADAAHDAEHPTCATDLS
jgi:hypothetical protein